MTEVHCPAACAVQRQLNRLTLPSAVARSHRVSESMTETVEGSQLLRGGLGWGEALRATQFSHGPCVARYTQGLSKTVMSTFPWKKGVDLTLNPSRDICLPSDLSAQNQKLHSFTFTFIPEALLSGCFFSSGQLKLDLVCFLPSLHTFRTKASPTVFVLSLLGGVHKPVLAILPKELDNVGQIHPLRQTVRLQACGLLVTHLMFTTALSTKRFSSNRSFMCCLSLGGEPVFCK